jgi:RND family efflux transporter MFP subunit
MVFIIGLYFALVYLVFFKFRWLPLNTATKTIIVGVGVFILLAVLTAMRTLTPTTIQAGVTTRIVEIAPQVSGQVDKIMIEKSVIVEAGTVLFTIDPTAYQSRVDEIEAQLLLVRLRVEQYGKLSASGAGSKFEHEQARVETRKLEAKLVGARFDLDNTSVRAPTRGMVPRLFLKEGTQVYPSKAVMAFLDTSELLVGGLFQQAALQNVRIGDRATVSFPALPGRVYESNIVKIPEAIGDVQFMASGKLPVIANTQTTRLFPIYASLPDDFPDHVKKVGLAATITVHTQGAGAISMVALAIQWINASIAILV